MWVKIHLCGCVTPWFVPASRQTCCQLIKLGITGVIYSRNVGVRLHSASLHISKPWRMRGAQDMSGMYWGRNVFGITLGPLWTTHAPDSEMRYSRFLQTSSIIFSLPLEPIVDC
ncbi:uncharacterized protein BCR38DRAFT_420395 [Pseudomassariella vexata]|uniref:Uncharacterized protein n=1 Tax=Pseudomassariella vexata TaxID=1141098 RepID=A0A1Y2EEB4_9PEZI|nr:uncharacterized protein BCR38DRAFT_420395 [Pseudomassariella vexata]ORY69912.1 hypothetical protein BCR38DRAFT_420395 [Pseudomassariella vexata]